MTMRQKLLTALLVFCVSVATQLVASAYNLFDIDVATWKAIASSGIIAVLVWFISVAAPAVKNGVSRALSH
jgi:hypothetical protein